MKKTIICITILLLIFSQLIGCSETALQINTEQNSDDYILKEDYQNYLNPYCGFVKGDNGYYFISNSLICFFDTTDNQIYPVCGKPDCSHNSESCSAFLSSFYFYPYILSYYNNALYVLGWETENSKVRHNYIYQISLETYKRKRAAYLFDSMGLDNIWFSIHRGYVYYLYNYDYSLSQKTASIYRVKLGNTKKNSSEKIYEFNGIGANISGLSAYGNNLFFMTSEYEDEAGNGYNTEANILNIHTSEVRKIADASFASYINDEYVYFENNTTEVNRVNINTNEEEFFCNIDGPAYISADSNYIYFDNRQKMYTDESFKDRKISVYDKSGKFITEVIPKNPKDDCYFGGDDIMIFKETVTGEVTESDGLKNFYVLDKSQLTLPDKAFSDMK